MKNGRAISITVPIDPDLTDEDRAVLLIPPVRDRVILKRLVNDQGKQG